MQRKAKVLLFIPNLQQGGAERQILELYRRLPRDRFEPALCVWEDVVHYKSYVPAGEPRYVLGHRRMGVRGLRALIRVLREDKPDILHVYRDKANFWARIATLWAPVPVVLTRCGNQGLSFAHRITERVLQRRCDRMLTNSMGVRRELVEDAHLAPDHVQVIPNFIDSTRFRVATTEQRLAARAQYGLAEDELAFVLPGRISHQKNQLGLVEAVAQLARERRLPTNLRILLAGRDRDRKISSKLSPLIERHGLSHVVRRIGTVAEHDMPGLYAAANAVLLPSHYEGLPNAIIEASHCGVPSIVSAIANEDDLVLDGMTGYEVPTADTARLADAIARMAALSSVERRDMGIAAAAHIKKLDPERILGEVVDLYDSLLAKKLPEEAADLPCAV